MLNIILINYMFRINYDICILMVSKFDHSIINDICK